MDIFRESFSGIKNALAIGDIDWFIESTNTVTEHMGGKAPFSNMEEFNSKMLMGNTFKLGGEKRCLNRIVTDEAALYYLYMLADSEISYSEEKVFNKICDS